MHRLVMKRTRRGMYRPPIREKVISPYAKGMSTRDIHDQIQELYGMKLSAEMVSKITDMILPEIKE